LESDLHRSINCVASLPVGKPERKQTLRTHNQTTKMKKLATLFVMMVVGLGNALAQGTIDFHNPNTFPVTVIDSAGTVTTIGTAASPLGPSSVRVGLFIGANGAPFSAMTLVAVVTNSPSGGALFAGTFNGGTSFIVPGHLQNETVSFAFAAWSISTGALTYDAAKLAPTGYFSPTPVVGNGYTLQGGAVLPPPTWGTPTALQPWLVNGLRLQPVPEPSTIVLGLLGAGALLLRRRK